MTSLAVGSDASDEVSARAKAPITREDRCNDRVRCFALLLLSLLTHFRISIFSHVSDGFNDSVALTAADIGISIGNATDIAMEAADIILMRSRLIDALTAMQLSRVVFRRIIFNFIWACVYNLFGVPFASGIFFPLLHRALPPELAAISMMMSSLSVLASSLLLKRFRATDFVESQRSIETPALLLREASMSDDFSIHMPYSINSINGRDLEDLSNDSRFDTTTSSVQTCNCDMCHLSKRLIGSPFHHSADAAKSTSATVTSSASSSSVASANQSMAMLRKKQNDRRSWYSKLADAKSDDTKALVCKCSCDKSSDGGCKCGCGDEC